MAQIDFSELGDDFDPLKINQGGLPKPGKAHLLVTAIEDKGEYVTIISEIVAHVDPSQVGKREYNNFSKSGAGVKRSLMFGLVTGIITTQDVIDAKATGNSITEIPFEDAESCSFLGTLVAGSHNGRDSCKVAFDFKSIDDPDAHLYPRNLQYAEALDDGGGVGDEPPVTANDKARSVGGALEKVLHAISKPSAKKPTTKQTSEIPF